MTDPSGEKAPRYIISDHPMTEEEWARERCGAFICVHFIDSQSIKTMPQCITTMKSVSVPVSSLMP